MRKPVTEMTDHELLMELVEEKRGNDRRRLISWMIRGAVLTAVLVLLFIYVPKIMAVYNEYKQTMDQLRQASQQMQDMFTSLQSSGLNELGSLVDQLSGYVEKLSKFLK